MIATKNNSYLFYMNLDDDKLYIKIIALDEIYNFVVETFSLESFKTQFAKKEII